MTAHRRTAFVTGGASGIGFAVTAALLERGWHVSICGRTPGRLDEAALRLGAGDRLFAERADVAVEDDVARWVSAGVARFGPPELLVNNAAVVFEGNVEDTTAAAWDETLAVNLRGAFLCTRAVLPLLRRRGGGLIVNVASIAGKIGMAGIAAYSASKAGLVAFTEAVAREGKADGVRATAICPGMVATPFVVGGEGTPPEAMIQPDDIARTILYLLELSPSATVTELVLKRLDAV